METQLLQRNSDPLLTQLILDGYKQLSSTTDAQSTGLGSVYNSDSRETQVYVVPSSKSDTPALIVWSRPLTSRKRLSSSTCTLSPEELLGVSAAKRALAGVSPWSDGRDRFDADAAAAAAAAATGAAASTTVSSAASPSQGVVTDVDYSEQQQSRRQSAKQQHRSSPNRQDGHDKLAAEEEPGTTPQTPAASAVGDSQSAAGSSRVNAQSVYSRYSEKQAYKRLLKVLRRHPYLDRDAIKYNKLLLLENSLNICLRFQAGLRPAANVGGHQLHHYQPQLQQQRLESLEDLAVEESHLVSAIRDHVTEIPYMAAFAPRRDKRAAKIEARVRRLEAQADACRGCQAMLCAHCLTAAAAAATAAAPTATTTVSDQHPIKKR